MDELKLQEELDRFSASPISKKSDRQLLANDAKSRDYKERFKNNAPEGILAYLKSGSKQTKLTQSQVDQIRSKYIPGTYGKRKLSKVYDVSVTLISKIIDRKIYIN